MRGKTRQKSYYKIFWKMEKQKRFKLKNKKNWYFEAYNSVEIPISFACFVNLLNYPRREHCLLAISPRIWYSFWYLSVEDRDLLFYYELTFFFSQNKFELSLASQTFRGFTYRGPRGPLSSLRSSIEMFFQKLRLGREVHSRNHKLKLSGLQVLQSSNLFIFQTFFKFLDRQFINNCCSLYSY